MACFFKRVSFLRVGRSLECYSLCALLTFPNNYNWLFGKIASESQIHRRKKMRDLTEGNEIYAICSLGDHSCRKKFDTCIISYFLLMQMIEMNMSSVVFSGMLYNCWNLTNFWLLRSLLIENFSTVLLFTIFPMINFLSYFPSRWLGGESCLLKLEIYSSWIRDGFFFQVLSTLNKEDLTPFNSKKYKLMHLWSKCASFLQNLQMQWSIFILLYLY